MTPPLVSIIILQYNNSQDTIGCLNSVGKLTFSNYKIIVVDNASTPEHLNNIKTYFENQWTETKTYELILSGSNLGYSGGNNLGIKHALEKGTDYILVLNADTTIEKDALTKLVEVGESNPKIGILGPAIDEGDKKVYGGKIAWLKTELKHNPGSASGYWLPTVSYIIGAAMLIKKEVLEKKGLLDKRYFLYFEDADYCIRARKAGYELALVPNALVAHAISASTSQLGSALLLRYHFRNAHLFNLKNGPWYIKLSLPFWSFFIIIKQLIKFFLRPAEEKISEAIMAGVGDFYIGRFGQINK